MHGVVIATAWIAFLAVLASLILLGIAGSIQMKDVISDADKAKMKTLGMAGYWTGVVGLVFLFIAAITASCGHKGLGDFLRALRQRIALGGGLGREALPAAAAALESL